MLYLAFSVLPLRRGIMSTRTSAAACLYALGGRRVMGNATVVCPRMATAWPFSTRSWSELAPCSSICSTVICELTSICSANMSLALSPRLVGAGRAVEAAAVGIAAVTVGAVVTVCWLGELVVFTVVLPPAGWPTVCWVSGPPAPPPGATVQVMTPLLPEPMDGTKPAGQLVVTVVVVLPQMV